jgi:RNA-binding protein 25
MKSLVDAIPTAKAELFRTPVDWATVDRAGIVGAKMRPWIHKKIAEYLGEPEETLVTFVVGKLQEHSAPGPVLEELELVLEDDAEVFMVKLWRMLIFEAMRAA